MNTVDHKALFHGAPDRYLLLAPDAPHFTILDVSDAYLAATMTERARIVGRGLFEVFPDNPDDPGADGTRNLRTSLETVIATRKPHAMAIQKYDIRKPDSDEFEERYWSPLNCPVLRNGAGNGSNDSGAVVAAIDAIIHRVDDVTHLVRLENAALQRTRELEQRNRELAAATDKLRQIAAERLAPVLLVAPGVLAIPVIGDVDDEHATHLTTTLLAGIRRERPHAAIIDLTAAAGFDTSLAHRLLQTTHAAKLLGVRVMLTGVTTEAALSFASLGVNLGSIETFGTLIDAIRSVDARSRHTRRR